MVVMKILFTVSFALLYVVGTGLSFFPVYGHANPVTYNLSPNKVFDSPQSLPDKVTITFTERPEVKASSIKVLNSANDRIDTNDLTISDSDKTLAVSIDKSKITPGVYTVSWAALSKDDGHITKGSYVFTVDDKNTQQAQNSQIKSNISSSTSYSKNFTTADDILLNFNVIPFSVGQNNFTLGVSHTNGTAVENIKNVFLEFNNPEKNLGPIAETMDKVGAGNYSKSGSFISQDGNWHIKITVQRIGEYDINENLETQVK
jgi:methionine-rich copper-binding protein CopC